jgi:hypothetical protein
VTAAKRMIERTMDRFDLYPARIAGDSAYGSAELLRWLVYQHGIEPPVRVRVFDKSARRDGTFSREEFTHDLERDVVCPAGKTLTTRGTLVNDGATLLYRASKFLKRPPSRWSSLQRARHGGAVGPRGQGRAALDAAVVPCLPAEPVVSSCSRWPTTWPTSRARSPCRARWRCRGRCSRRSGGALIGCAARPCRRRDTAERGGREAARRLCTEGDERHRSSPIRPWSRIWRSSAPRIRLSTAPTALGRLRSAPNWRRLDHGHAAFGEYRLRTGASRVGPPHSVGSSGRKKSGPLGR